MVAKGFSVSIFKDAKNYPGHLTLFLIFICVVANIGNLFLGYDLGISSDISLPGGARLRLSINPTDQHHGPPESHAQLHSPRSHPQLSGQEIALAHPRPHPPRGLLRQSVDASIPTGDGFPVAVQKAEPVVPNDDHRRNPGGKYALGQRVAHPTAARNGGGGRYLRGRSRLLGHSQLDNIVWEGQRDASPHYLRRKRGGKVRRSGGGEHRIQAGVDMCFCERLCMVFSQETGKIGEGADKRLCERLCAVVGIRQLGGL